MVISLVTIFHLMKFFLMKQVVKTFYMRKLMAYGSESIRDVKRSQIIRENAVMLFVL